MTSSLQTGTLGILQRRDCDVAGKYRPLQDIGAQRRRFGTFYCYLRSYLNALINVVDLTFALCALSRVPLYHIIILEGVVINYLLSTKNNVFSTQNK